MPDESATHSVGQKLASLVKPPCLISLSGPLGAGKTSLVRSFIRAFGVTGPIKSPSYALVEPYNLSSFSIYHFDFYRFFDKNEWEESGFRDTFSENAIWLVEWPDKASGLLPATDLSISLAYQDMAGSSGNPGRVLTIQAQSPRGQAIVQQLSI